MNTKKKVNPKYKHLVKSGERHTTDPDLAIDIARATGKKPIEYISPRVREAYKKAYPKLLKAVK